MKIGFDNELYIEKQSKCIKDRIKMFDKLYLEIGGKLFDDYHAARVLPGFKANAKIKMFEELKDDLEIIFCINANDIERNKTRAEFGITYDIEVLRLIDNLKNLGFSINSVVITLYENQNSALKFINKLNSRNIKTYIHTYTKGYPTDVETIVSEEGYGANPYIETSKKLVLVNAPGPGSGKLATCLSQLYHEHKRGVNAGYAKFETFPVWNLPLKHPVNMAYEAATADLKDVNMIDSFHLEEYGVTSVNYNRDLEMFPVLKTILNRIMGKDIYKSPTDMGVNMIGYCITDDEVVCLSSKKEIIRRFYEENNNCKLGLSSHDTVLRIKLLMNELGISENDNDLVSLTLDKSKKENRHVITMRLNNKTIVTGNQTGFLSPSSNLIINALKVLTRMPDEIDIISPSILQTIIDSKKNVLKESNMELSLKEVLIALSISSVTNPMTHNALKKMKNFEGCEAHSSFMISKEDLTILKNLGINVTCESLFYSDRLYD